MMWATGYVHEGSVTTLQSWPRITLMANPCSTLNTSTCTSLESARATVRSFCVISRSVAIPLSYRPASPVKAH